MMKAKFKTRQNVLKSHQKQQPPKIQKTEQSPETGKSNNIIKTNYKQKQITPINNEIQGEDIFKSQMVKTKTVISQKSKLYQSRFSKKTQKNQQQYLQARDRKTILKYDFKGKSFSLNQDKERLNLWLGEMHFKVVSASFNLYIANSLTFEQAKVHCCENLLLNILLFIEALFKPSEQDEIKQINQENNQQNKNQLSYLDMTNLLKHINDVLSKNLQYMQIKYPLTKDTKPNKTLQSLISKINNLGNDELDYIMKSKVKFYKKKEDNYTAQIMQFINFILQKQIQPSGTKGKNNKQVSYYQSFYETMEKIFVEVYIPEYDTKKVQAEPEKENPFASLSKIVNNVVDPQKKIFEDAKQLKQYKEKVLKYTHYLIGRKLSSNTELYSDLDIQTEIFDVKNSSILRILAKWTEELELKIINAEENILKRPFRFKKNAAFEFSKLNANQKNDLYQETKRRIIQVNSIAEEIRQNYNEIQAMLGSHIKQPSLMKNIPINEYRIGSFCSKLQSAASSTLLSYLNKIIHILLSIPQQLKNQNINDAAYCNDVDINLVTFKISDLFRCKFKSKQAQIIRVFKHIKKISEQGEPFKIVRIKDRLNLGTRDILINILFLNIFLCQIQLAVEEYIDTKQQSYDSFSHFLYELHRSQLGPIMQSACIWAQFDQRSKIYRLVQQNEDKKQCKFIFHKCGKKAMINNKYPFVCSLCENFYSTQQGLIYHKKCNICKIYYECSICIFKKMNSDAIAQLINLKQKLGIFISQFQLWLHEQNQSIPIPKYGLLISKKMRKVQIIFFQIIVFKRDAYLLHIDNNGQIQILQKIIGNSPKLWKKILNYYIIYEWAQKKFNNLTIKPDKLQEDLLNQKLAKQAAEQKKKLEREKKKQELEEKRKQQDQKRKKKIDQPRPQTNSNNRKKNEEVEGQYIEGRSKQNKDDDDKPVKKTKYNTNIAQKKQDRQFRVIIKQDANEINILVLGTFLSQSQIRNRLKAMNNKNILKKLATQKIEVLFLQEEYIHNEINEIDYLTEAQILQLKQTIEKVSQIYLDNNFIEQIDILQNMLTLKVVHLSNNRISNLSPLLNLKHITQLIVENNLVDHLDDIGLKPQLVQLNLNRNRIQYLDIKGENFGKLKNLFLSGNFIEVMDGLINFQNLIKLDLSHNYITQIRQLYLPKLQQLDLSQNKLQRMNGIQTLVNLQKLNLSGNQIKFISKTILSLVALIDLDLSSNKIKKIKNIPVSLRFLDLSKNYIQKMEGFDNLQNLQVLKLKQNQIREVENYLDLTNLKKLDLTSNSIQELSFDGIQKYLTYLSKIFLHQNPIKSTQFNHKIIKNLAQRSCEIHLEIKDHEFDFQTI